MLSGVASVPMTHGLTRLFLSPLMHRSAFAASGVVFVCLLATIVSALFGDSLSPVQLLSLGISAGASILLVGRIRKDLTNRIIELSPGAIYIFDIRKRMNTFVNRGLADALGYDHTRAFEDGDFIQSVMHPADWPQFVEYLDRLAGLKHGETGEFEYRLKNSGGVWRWFHSRDRAFATNLEGRVREIIGAAADITERKGIEEKAVFISNLNQALAPLADPREIMAVAVRMLGEHLGVDRCGYAEVELDEDHFIVRSDYTRGATPSIVGRYCMSDFGERERNVLRGNHPYVVNDIVAESPVGTDLSLYERGQIRAMVCVPLNKSGNFVARMAVQQSTPRHWSNEEIQLVNTVAERCWESVERARAVRNLKDSDERYRAFIANSSEAIWRFEVDQPIPIDISEDEQIEMFFQFGYLAECNDATARMYGFDTANQIIGARIKDLLLRSDPKNIDFLRTFRRGGYRISDAETRELDRFGNTKYFLNNMSGVEKDGGMVLAWGRHREITLQKQAEQALRASEERLRRITDATQDALWEIDLKTHQLWWSEGARALFNVSSGELRMGLEDWYAGIHPEDVGRVKAKFDAFMWSTELDWTDEYRFKKADGSYAYILDQGRKSFDRRGVPVLIAGAMSDITDRKLAEEALRESEERFSKAFRASPDGLVISRISDGIILEVNDGFVAMSGYSRDELVGNSTLALDLYADPAIRVRAVQLMKQQNYVRDMEFAMKTKSGEVRLVAFSAQPLELRGEHCWLTLGRDITERKLVEEARRLSEAEARRQLAYVEAIYATAPVGLCFVDTDLRYRSINERLAEMNGKPVKDHIGRTLREVVPDIADAAEPYYRGVIETGVPILNIESSMVARSGAVQHFIVSYYPIKDREGRVLGVNVVVMEITQRKTIENELERLLLQEKAAREEAEAANRTKDEFLATISHELRTPLTSILGWARMLVSGTLPEKETRHAQQVIVQSAQSQTRLIDDILDTSRIITGRLKLDAHPVPIERVFQAAVDVIRPSAEAKQIALTVVVDDPRCTVFGDASRLQQAIWNLLSNAVKFTNEGGRIYARLARADGQVEISIADTGVGIEPRFLPHVFERFRQADSSSTRRYGGLGLGLAIVRHIVEMHGGTVSASSPGPGQGATFKVRFPVATSRPQQLETSPPQSGAKQIVDVTPRDHGRMLYGVRVLVVEDDPDTLDMLKFILDKRGAQVTTAASAKEALEAVDRSKPDVLVSDVAMPNQDGFELIGRLRSRAPERGGNIPAAALTAYTREEDRQRALSAGFQSYVRKPVDPEELVAVVAGLTRHNGDR